jgi:hypothetical protein
LQDTSGLAKAAPSSFLVKTENPTRNSESAKPTGTQLARAFDVQNLTIGEAIRIYTTDGTDCMSPTFRDMVQQMIDKGVKTEFANDSYLDALFLTDVMFTRASRSVRLLTGKGADGFLKTLSDRFETMLERFAKTEGRVKIILVADVLPAWLTSLVQRFPQVLQVACASASRPVKHFIVCDSKMARLEEIHGELHQHTPATDIKARVFFNEPETASVFEGYFEQIWSVVSKYPVNRGSQGSAAAAATA